MKKLAHLLSIFMAAGLVTGLTAFVPREAPQFDAETHVINMGEIATYLRKKPAHYPISDSFIETYQQSSGGYIDYAKQLGKVVDKSLHEPDQKWHFFDSWLNRSILDGSITWAESAQSRVYNKLLCPELLLWIYEACEVDASLVAQAKEVAVAGKDAGTSVSTIAKSMRGIVSWSSLESNILAGISDSDPHYIDVRTIDGVSVSPMSLEGYLPDEYVEFTVDSDPSKEVSHVIWDGAEIPLSENGVYRLKMPAKNIVLEILAQDVGGEEPEPTPTEFSSLVNLSFPAENQTSTNRYTSTFTCSSGSTSFRIFHASNGSNKWNYIGIGTTGSANTASITTTTPISGKVGGVKLNFSALKTSGLDSAKLYVSSTSDFASSSVVDFTSSVALGEILVTIPEAERIENGYYQLEFVTNASQSSNGYIHLDSLDFGTIPESGEASLTWMGKEPIDVYKNTSIEQASDVSRWNFLARLEDGSIENPSVGLLEDEVHIGLYPSPSPSEEGVALDTSYRFKAEDNGKYLVAFYKGIRSSSNQSIRVIDSRKVAEELNEEIVTYDFSSIAKTSSTALTNEGFAAFFASNAVLEPETIAEKAYPQLEVDSGAIKAGTSNFALNILLTFGDEVKVNRIKVVAKRYSESEGTLMMNGTSIALGAEYAEYEVNSTSAGFIGNHIVSLSTPNSQKRCYIKSIVIELNGAQDRGRSADCLAIESFVKGALHMEDYVDGLGYCADEEHHYYETAKSAFSALTPFQKSLFLGNSAYANEAARLSSWASANGEVLLESGIVSRIKFKQTSKQENIAWVLLASLCSCGAILAATALNSRRRRK